MKQKHPTKSKTVWGLVATAAGTAAMFAGLAPDTFQFLSDGLQWVDLVPAVAAAGAIVSAYGLRTADTQLTKLNGKQRYPITKPKR